MDLCPWSIQRAINDEVCDSKAGEPVDLIRAEAIHIDELLAFDPNGDQTEGLRHAPIDADIIGNKQDIVVWWLTQTVRNVQQFTGERITNT